MKKGILVLLLVSSVFADAQTLKEALYSGKLKNGSGTVIRKGDDLTPKMDTAQKAATDETAKTTAPLAGADSSAKSLPVQTDSTAFSTTDNGNSTADATVANIAEATPAPKNNNILLKAYMDSVVNILTTEALSSKKVKRGDYFVLVTYTIGTDGQVTVGDVALSPENTYLQQQIKDRLASDTPRLNPVLNSAGAPRKVIKKYSFTLSKK